MIEFYVRASQKKLTTMFHALLISFIFLLRDKYKLAILPRGNQ